MSYRGAALGNIEDLYRELGTEEEGLSSDEARQRLRRYGPNTLPSAKKANLLRRFILQLKNWFSILLSFASVLSFLSGFIYSDEGSFYMGSAILIVVFLIAFFSLIQEYRAEKIVQAVTKLIPTKAKVFRDGQPWEVKVTEVVPGDIVLLEEGDRVPADLRLISAFEVSVDNSILTGESDPQRRFSTTPITSGTVSTMEFQNILFAGTTVVTGTAKGIVIKTGKETEFGRVVSLSREIKEPLSTLQREIDYMGKMNLLVAVLVGVTFFGVALVLVNLTITESILFAVGVIISLVPEGFQLTVSLSLALTAFAMSKRNVVVKRLSSVQTLGSMTVLCVDKTGTITSGEMMIEKLLASGRVFRVTGDGYNPKGFVTVEGRKTDRSERPHILRLFEVAAFCNNAKLNPPSDRIGRWTVLGDPTDGAFLVFAGKGDFNVAQALAKNPRIGFLPFGSQRRMMTSIHRSSDGNAVVYTKGACLEVLDRCTSIFYNNRSIPLTDEVKKIIVRQMDDFAREGYRILAMAMKVLPHETFKMTPDVEREMTFLGLAALRDPPRPGVEIAVREANRAGVRVMMLTGDYELTAETIAKKTGIITTSNHVVISGSELSQMTDEEVVKILDEKEIVFARIAPEQKLRIVKILKSKGETVAATGDGVNDAPALLEANVGIAMGAGGTDIARESSDMILLDNNFVSIIEGIKFGRSTLDNLRRFVHYVFTHNFAQLSTFIAFVLLGIPLPLTVLQILAIDLGMDVLPSLALIVEPPEPGVLTRSPKRIGSRLIDARILLRSLYLGLVVASVALWWAFNIWSQAGWVFGQNTVADPTEYARGTTAVMAAIMAGQLGNIFAARTSRESAFAMSLLRNKWLLIGILAQIGILIAIVYVPFLQSLFGTASLPFWDLLLIYSLAPLVLFLEELRKFFVRKIK
ncbi:MAG: cation-transporting P-type ATPase [Thaumarchaeota archaeon]|nr:cation-transporting P-type ATPase [Nitrososphaerota archaeon]